MILSFSATLGLKLISGRRRETVYDPNLVSRLLPLQPRLFGGGGGEYHSIQIH